MANFKLNVLAWAQLGEGSGTVENILGDVQYFHGHAVILMTTQIFLGTLALITKYMRLAQATGFDLVSQGQRTLMTTSQQLQALA